MMTNLGGSMDVTLNLCEDLSPRHLRRAWIKSGGSSDPNWIAVWQGLLDGVDPQEFMTVRERNRFARLPDVFLIYRGYRHRFGTPTGLSWSLSKTVAKWFATDERSMMINGHVVERLVNKSQVFAYIEKESGTFNEQEILLKQPL